MLEEERRRIRRDLHDGLGPSLATVVIGLEEARAVHRDDPERTERLLGDLKQQTRGAIERSVSWVYGLRPPALDELGLRAALEQLVDGTIGRSASAPHAGRGDYVDAGAGRGHRRHHRPFRSTRYDRASDPSEPRAMNALRVVVVDDHPAFRMGLAGMLSTVDSIELVGDASDGNEAIERVRELRPDVVLMDLHMPGLSGIEATKEVTTDEDGPAVVVLTMIEDDDALLAAMRAGASGYLLKGADKDDVVRAAPGDRYRALQWCRYPAGSATARFPAPAGGTPIRNPGPIPPGGHPAEVGCRMFRRMEDVSPAWLNEGAADKR